MKVKQHYDRHLGNFYSWMMGDLDQKREEHRKYFQSLNLDPKSGSVAFDLGCGHGIQSLALADIGFRVLAVDFNAQLLNELKLNRQERTIETVNADLHQFLKGVHEKAGVIVCMGDTLTHLENLKSIEQLFISAHQQLLNNGKLVLSFRDLTTELMHEQRFIPVKSADEKILTCFLEYFPDHVMVHDILHEKENGKWIQKISAYPKLRISERTITEMLIQTGFIVTSSAIINRMLYIAAEKN
jgi:2-polyprenyl-3-methyl-5-hydroxy-6-metoxy-1,4-benzoquinol methylase